MPLLAATTRRVLVVEDEPLVYDAICSALAMKRDIVASYAADGEMAMSMLAMETPELALIDVLLPKVSGLKVAERAASQGTGVILMSGHPSVIGAGAGAYRFPMIFKPFRISHFVEKIEALLSEAVAMRGRAIDAPQTLQPDAPMARTELDRDQASARWYSVCERHLPQLFDHTDGQ